MQGRGRGRGGAGRVQNNRGAVGLLPLWPTRAYLQRLPSKTECGGTGRCSATDGKWKVKKRREMEKLKRWRKMGRIWNVS